MKALIYSFLMLGFISFLNAIRPDTDVAFYLHVYEGTDSTKEKTYLCLFPENSYEATTFNEVARKHYNHKDKYANDPENEYEVDQFFFKDAPPNTHIDNKYKLGAKYLLLQEGDYCEAEVYGYLLYDYAEEGSGRQNENAFCLKHITSWKKPLAEYPSVFLAIPYTDKAIKPIRAFTKPTAEIDRKKILDGILSKSNRLERLTEIVKGFSEEEPYIAYYDTTSYQLDNKATLGKYLKVLVNEPVMVGEDIRILETDALIPMNGKRMIAFRGSLSLLVILNDKGEVIYSTILEGMDSGTFYSFDMDGDGIMELINTNVSGGEDYDLYKWVNNDFKKLGTIATFGP